MTLHWVTPRLTRIAASAHAEEGTRRGITENGHVIATKFTTVNGGTGCLHQGTSGHYKAGLGIVAPFGSP